MKSRMSVCTGLFLGLMAATSSVSMAAQPPDTRISETSVAVSKFAASHQRMTARFGAEDREILDQLSAKVRRALPRNAQIPGDVLRILSSSMHGLTHDEIDALGTYVIGSISSGDGDSSLLQATRQMQETQMSFNLQYLQLQSQMQNENRSYTAVSNIMKTKHDTVKNSISNIR
jgi:hypothetical protein